MDMSIIYQLERAANAVAAFDANQLLCARAAHVIKLRDAEIKRLRAALKPFAVMADHVDEWQKGTNARVGFSFAASDLRHAREVLNQQHAERSQQATENT